MNHNSSKQVKLLATAAASALAGVGFATQASASVPQYFPAVNVLFSQTSDGDTLNGPTSNLDVNPTTYTPSLTAIPYAPGATYDAADTTDSGTYWNQLLAPPIMIATNSTGAPLTITFQQNIPLTSSTHGSSATVLNPSGIQLNVLFVEPNNKSDGFHSPSLVGPNTGSDGLTINPSALMSLSWEASSPSDTLIFQLTGLIPNSNYNLYMYGTGPNGGNGGAFSLLPANQGAGYGSGAGWVSTAGLNSQGAYITEPTSGTFHSVFSSNGGNNPTPEQGISWVLLPSFADANGNISIFEQPNLVTEKSFINGFQIQSLTPYVPEPASLGLLAAAATTALARRHKRQ
jgi:hypothetical protein